MTTGATLHVEDLRVTYPGPPPVRAVDGVSLTVAPGQCLGILGESGSGKSTLGSALLGLHTDARLEGGLRLGDVDLTTLDEEGWRPIRWRRIALGFQSTTALNPVLRVGEQVAEPVRVHLGAGHREATERAEALLEEIGPGAWAAGRYPSELSGGQRRLALLALALACDPEVLVLDEPTAGLDPVTRARVLEVLVRLRDARSRSIVMLGHDADALEVLATDVAILYRGWLAEIGPAADVLATARSPYGWALLNARPTLASVKDLRGIRGAPPDPTEVAEGCPFLGRCTQSVDECADGRPPLVPPRGEVGPRAVACVRAGVVPVLSARGLRKTYKVSGRVLRPERVAAVDGVDVEVREGEVVGLVGATGAGKSTLAMLLLRLLEADGGTVEFEGNDLLAARDDALKAMRSRAQLLFQDPHEAISTHMTVRQVIREPLDVQVRGAPEDRDDVVRQALLAVRLPADERFLGRRSHEMSGGQLQRVGLARALVLEPKLLVADEPVSMLDPSEQAKMLQLLKQLQVDRGMAMVLVSHDLATVLRVADRVIVLDQGRVVEEGTGSRLLLYARHPVTRALLEAAGRDPALALAMDRIVVANGHAGARPRAVEPEVTGG
ncbi:MAG TPA: ABC transporter ATP-binding protein [Acidimicrobiales bacterium]|nr:ABC transporter ATP-binding protein [Acidimicrobiales bacterium]